MRTKGLNEAHFLSLLEKALSRTSPDPDENEKTVKVEIGLPDRTVTSRVKVGAEETDTSEGDPKPRFIPFPISLPEDPELVWVLARREDLAPEEATRALASIQEEFWATKNGQKLLRGRRERSFAEFVAHVPASTLLESGLKRHYKEPESLKTLRALVTGYNGIDASLQ